MEAYDSEMEWMSEETDKFPFRNDIHGDGATSFGKKPGTGSFNVFRRRRMNPAGHQEDRDGSNSPFSMTKEQNTLMSCLGFLKRPPTDEEKSVVQNLASMEEIISGYTSGEMSNILSPLIVKSNDLRRRISVNGGGAFGNSRLLTSGSSRLRSSLVLQSSSGLLESFQEPHALNLNLSGGDPDDGGNFAAQEHNPNRPLQLINRGLLLIDILSKEDLSSTEIDRNWDVLDELVEETLEKTDAFTGKDAKRDFLLTILRKEAERDRLRKEMDDGTEASIDGTEAEEVSIGGASTGDSTYNRSSNHCPSADENSADDSLQRESSSHTLVSSMSCENSEDLVSLNVRALKGRVSSPLVQKAALRIVILNECLRILESGAAVQMTKENSSVSQVSSESTKTDKVDARPTVARNGTEDDEVKHDGYEVSPDFSDGHSRMVAQQDIYYVSDGLKERGEELESSIRRSGDCGLPEPMLKESPSGDKGPNMEATEDSMACQQEMTALSPTKSIAAEPLPSKQNQVESVLVGSTVSEPELLRSIPTATVKSGTELTGSQLERFDAKELFLEAADLSEPIATEAMPSLPMTTEQLSLEPNLAEPMPNGRMPPELMPTDPTLTKLMPSESVPIGPTQTNLIVIDAEPSESELTELVPTEAEEVGCEPGLVALVSSDLVPAEQVQSDLVAAEPMQADLVPTEPVRTILVTTEPVLTDLVPTEQAPPAVVQAKSVLAEPEPAKPNLVKREPAEAMPVKCESAGSVPTDLEAAEPKLVKRESAELVPTDLDAAEPMLVKHESGDSVPTDLEAAEMLVKRESDDAVPTDLEVAEPMLVKRESAESVPTDLEAAEPRLAKRESAKSVPTDLEAAEPLLAGPERAAPMPDASAANQLVHSESGTAEPVRAESMAGNLHSDKTFSCDSGAQVSVVSHRDDDVDRILPALAVPSASIASIPLAEPSEAEIPVWAEVIENDGSNSVELQEPIALRGSKQGRYQDVKLSRGLDARDGRLHRARGFERPRTGRYRPSRIGGPFLRLDGIQRGVYLQDEGDESTEGTPKRAQNQLDMEVAHVDESEDTEQVRMVSTSSSSQSDGSREPPAFGLHKCAGPGIAAGPSMPRSNGEDKADVGIFRGNGRNLRQVSDLRGRHGNEAFATMPPHRKVTDSYRKQSFVDLPNSNEVYRALGNGKHGKKSELRTSSRHLSPGLNTRRSVADNNMALMRSSKRRSSLLDSQDDTIVRLSMETSRNPFEVRRGVMLEDIRRCSGSDSQENYEQVLLERELRQLQMNLQPDHWMQQIPPPIGDDDVGHGRGFHREKGGRLEREAFANADVNINMLEKPRVAPRDGAHSGPCADPFESAKVEVAKEGSRARGDTEAEGGDADPAVDPKVAELAEVFADPRAQRPARPQPTGSKKKRHLESCQKQMQLIDMLESREVQPRPPDELQKKRSSLLKNHWRGPVANLIRGGSNDRRKG